MKLKSAIKALFIICLLLLNLSAGYGEEPAECYEYLPTSEWENFERVRENVEKAERIPPTVLEDLQNRALNLEINQNGFYTGTDEVCKEFEEYFAAFETLKEYKEKKNAEMDMFKREFDEYETECVRGGSSWNISDCKIWKTRLEAWREELESSFSEINKKELELLTCKDSVDKSMEERITLLQDLLSAYLHDAKEAILNSRLDVLNEEIKILQTKIKGESDKLDEFGSTFPSYIQEIKKWPLQSEEDCDEVIKKSSLAIASFLIAEYVIGGKGSVLLSQKKLGDIRKNILNSWNSDMQKKFSSELVKLKVPQSRREFGEQLYVILDRCDSKEEIKKVISLIYVFAKVQIRMISESYEFGMMLLFFGDEEGEIAKNIQYLTERENEEILSLIRLSEGFIKNITDLRQKENEKGAVMLELIDIE